MISNKVENSFRDQVAGTPDHGQGSGTSAPPRVSRCPTISEIPQADDLAVGQREHPGRLSDEQSGWGRIKSWSAKLDDSLIGDIIGAVCLIIIIYFSIFTAGVLI
jgi:hypothetical protein